MGASTSASQICFCIPLKAQYISEILVNIALTYGAIEGIKKTNFHKIFKIQLFEDFVKNAKHYVQLAEMKNGFIPKPVNYEYIWGTSLKDFENFK